MYLSVDSNICIILGFLVTTFSFDYGSHFPISMSSMFLIVSGHYVRYRQRIWILLFSPEECFFFFFNFKQTVQLLVGHLELMQASFYTLIGQICFSFSFSLRVRHRLYSLALLLSTVLLESTDVCQASLTWHNSHSEHSFPALGSS